MTPLAWAVLHPARADGLLLAEYGYATGLLLSVYSIFAQTHSAHDNPQEALTAHI